MSDTEIITQVYGAKEEKTGDVTLPVSRGEFAALKRAHEQLISRVAALEATHGEHLSAHDEALEAHDRQLNAITESFERLQGAIHRDFSGLTDRVTSELTSQKIQLQQQGRALEAIDAGMRRMLEHFKLGGGGV